MQNDLLRLENVSVFYGPVQALSDINIRVAPGELVSVLGGNASGKSTTVKTVLGLVRPKDGAVYFEGQRIDGLGAHQVIRLGVGSIPEGRRVFAEMSVRENLLLGAYTRRGAGDRLVDDLERVADMFPALASRMEQAAGTMSGGEQQMVAMARAWMRRPRLLCIDEPSMGLSPLYVDKVYDVIRRMKAEGVTILMVEQSANRALEVADRAYVLQNGRIVLEGDARDIASDPAIRRAYLGEATDVAVG